MLYNTEYDRCEHIKNISEKKRFIAVLDHRLKKKGGEQSIT
ncbi:hypothetical protein BACINT_03994 [Bacteroides intestinalis DSM 17393]|uniref:Uncharacterized protein n=1 Tax=Bacteroides intestinalis DSM 17393 TaxID=471870 RepID=B3CDK7_9BACE|nr:hypothetical protein BACINT_03994 [Bacteroides intestinalis DSM 17393]